MEKEKSYEERKQELINHFISHTIWVFANEIKQSYPYDMSQADISKYKNALRGQLNIPAYPVTDEEFEKIINIINNKLRQFVNQLILEDEKKRNQLNKFKNSDYDEVEEEQKSSIIKKRNLGEDNMEELLIILESLTIEQYKKFFNNKLIFTPAIKYRKPEYIQMLSSGNDYLKLVLNKLIDNNVNIVNSTFVDGKTTIQFIIAKDDLKFIKYIKEHINLNDLKINLLNNCISVKISINDERNLIIFNKLIDNYLIVNPLTNVSDNDISRYILESYMPVNEEYIKYFNVVNKNDIMFLKEKHRQKTFQFGNNDFFEIDNPLENSISIFEIYNRDSKFQNIPYESLTNDMKYVMCNKYFQNVFETRLKIACKILIEQYKTIFNVNFNEQNQLNLTNYGITGNLPPFDNDIPNIEIFLYGNLNFCKIEGENALFNEDLFGQVILTVLHEHEHILQRIGLIDENLKASINVFESLSNENSNYYIDNYYKDPSELDANLKSFIRFNNISFKLGISNPDSIIMKRVKNIISKADESFDIYKGSIINNINDVYNVLNENLDESIQEYLNYSGKKI